MRKGNIQFRLATVDDARDIYEMEGICFEKNKGELADLEEFVKAGCTTVVLAKNGVGRIIGYMMLHGAKVTNMGVHPLFRREGIARQMIIMAEVHAEKRKEVPNTRVHEDNVAAQMLLRSCGWKCVEILKRKRGEKDVYVFCKK